MNKKQRASHLEAMMHASGLDPEMEDDYYQRFSGESIGRFCDSICCFFNVKRDSWMFHFNNLDWIDSPSATIKFFTTESDQLNR